MALLIVQQEGRPLRWVELGPQPLTIGRDPQNHLCLECPMVSRRHAMIGFAEGRHAVSDLNSRYGTFVNDERAERSALNDGDRVRVGSCTLWYAAYSGPGARPGAGPATGPATRLGQAMRSIVGLRERVVQLDEQDRVVYINSGFARLLGRDRRTLLGKPLAEIDALPWAPGLLAGLLAEARRETRPVERLHECRDQAGRDLAHRVRVTLEQRGPQIVIEDVSEFRNLERYFSRFVSPEVLARMQAEHRDFFRAERQVLTVLFADLRAFSTAAERLTPEDVKVLVDGFMSAMDDVVQQHEATLDKFVGDQAVVLCGAPIANPDHARQALRVARDMLLAQERLKAAWRAEGRVALELGVGINSGEMVVGYVGNETRGQYTVLGSGVNVAARLCEQAPPASILLGERTRLLAGEAGWPPGLTPPETIPVLLKGISAPVPACRTGLAPAAGGRGA